MAAKKDNDWKDRLGMVYSTNPDFKFQTSDESGDGAAQEETVPPSQQKLRLRMEKNGRGGKTVTVISGFRGPQSELEQLARSLKTFCGCGGSCKDGEIVIQGDMRPKLLERLHAQGYTNAK